LVLSLGQAAQPLVVGRNQLIEEMESNMQTKLLCKLGLHNWDKWEYSFQIFYEGRLLNYSALKKLFPQIELEIFFCRSANKFVEDEFIHCEYCMSIRKCLDCGKISKRIERKHKWLEWSFDKSTCKMKKVCKICNSYIYKDPEHKWGNWTLDKNNCVHIRSCLVCNENQITSIDHHSGGGLIIDGSPIGNHPWGEIIIDEDKGLIVRICQNCKKQLDRLLQQEDGSINIVYTIEYDDNGKIIEKAIYMGSSRRRSYYEIPIEYRSANASLSLFSDKFISQCKKYEVDEFRIIEAIYRNDDDEYTILETTHEGIVAYKNGLPILILSFGNKTNIEEYIKLMNDKLLSENRKTKLGTLFTINATVDWIYKFGREEEQALGWEIINIKKKVQ
jgi:hypothetical protein